MHAHTSTSERDQLANFTDPTKEKTIRMPLSNGLINIFIPIIGRGVTRGNLFDKRKATSLLCSALHTKLLYAFSQIVKSRTHVALIQSTSSTTVISLTPLTHCSRNVHSLWSDVQMYACVCAGVLFSFQHACAEIALCDPKRKFCSHFSAEHYTKQQTHTHTHASKFINPHICIKLSDWRWGLYRENGLQSWLLLISFGYTRTTKKKEENHTGHNKLPTN